MIQSARQQWLCFLHSDAALSPGRRPAAWSYRQDRRTRHGSATWFSCPCRRACGPLPAAPRASAYWALRFLVLRGRPLCGRTHDLPWSTPWAAWIPSQDSSLGRVLSSTMALTHRFLCQSHRWPSLASASPWRVGPTSKALPSWA